MLGADRKLLPISAGLHRLEIPLGEVDLNAGKYSFVIGIRDAGTAAILRRVQGLCPFRVLSRTTHWGRIVRPVMLKNNRSGREAL